jgi:hypothetical protein
MPPALTYGNTAARLLFAAFLYFVLVMISGFVFGAVREFILIPAFGRETGELLEWPLMLVAIATTAWLVTGWLRVPADLGRRLTMGVVSLSMVLAAELGLSPFVRGSVQAWFDSFTPLTLSVALLLWAAHAAMPSPRAAEPQFGAELSRGFPVGNRGVQGAALVSMQA